MSVSLISPIDKARINTLRKSVNKYLQDNHLIFKNLDNAYFNGFDTGVNVNEYVTKKRINSKSKPITFRFIKDSNEVTLVIKSIDKLFRKEITTSNNEVKVYNLIPGTYTWKVSNSETRTFTITNRRRFIYGHLIHNVRDIGGIKTIDGHQIKYGLLFRGIELTTKAYRSKIKRSDYGVLHHKHVSKEDIPLLLDLGFKQEIDFRWDHESNFCNKCNIDSNISYIREKINSYTKFLTDDKFKSYQRIFKTLSNADKKPIYLHCWGGADRTGTICFLLEAILGATLEDLVIDYELTSFASNITRAKKWDEKIDYKFREEDNFYTMINFFINYSKEGETIKETVTRYVINELKISPQIIDKIRKIYLI